MNLLLGVKNFENATPNKKTCSKILRKLIEIRNKCIDS
jgi:hypothetical protein